MKYLLDSIKYSEADMKDLHEPVNRRNNVLDIFIKIKNSYYVYNWTVPLNDGPKSNEIPSPIDTY